MRKTKIIQMGNDNEVFQLESNSGHLIVEKLYVNKQVLFRITFSNGKGLFVTKASNFTGEKFWTSVPEGNPELAEQIGGLIEDHYKALN